MNPEKERGEQEGGRKPLVESQPQIAGGGLTIVVPVRNRARLIGRCLDSALRQTFRPLRVVVVDNGSSDATPEAVREWVTVNKVSSNLCQQPGNDPRFRLDLFEEPTPGASAARNRGLAEVATDWVYFFDSDDEMVSSLAADAMEASSDADIVYWKVCVCQSGRSRVKPFSKRRIARRHIFNGMLCTQAFMVRTEFLRGAGGWNVEAAVWNDWEVAFRLLLSGPRITVLDKVEAQIYPQKESITGTSYAAKAGAWEATLDIFDAIIDRLPSERVESGPFRGYTKRRLHGMISYRRAILAALYKREGHVDLSRALMEKALSSPSLSGGRRLLLRFLSAYTSAGGRAAYLLWH